MTDVRTGARATGWMATGAGRDLLSGEEASERERPRRGLGSSRAPERLAVQRPALGIRRMLGEQQRPELGSDRRPRVVSGERGGELAPQGRRDRVDRAERGEDAHHVFQPSGPERAEREGLSLLGGVRQLLAQRERLLAPAEGFGELGTEPDALIGRRELREDTQGVRRPIETDVGLHQLVVASRQRIGPGQRGQTLRQVRELGRRAVRRGEGEELARRLHRGGILGRCLRPGGARRVGPTNGEGQVTGLDPEPRPLHRVRRRLHPRRQRGGRVLEAIVVARLLEERLPELGGPGRSPLGEESEPALALGTAAAPRLLKQRVHQRRRRARDHLLQRLEQHALEPAQRLEPLERPQPLLVRGSPARREKHGAMERHGEVHRPAGLGELGARLELGPGAVLQEQSAQPAQRLATGGILREPPEALADAGRVLERLGDLQRLREGALREQWLVPVLDGLRPCAEAEEARRPGTGAQRLGVEPGHALEQLLGLGRISCPFPGLGGLEQQPRSVLGGGELRGLGERGGGLCHLARVAHQAGEQQERILACLGGHRGACKAGGARLVSGLLCGSGGLVEQLRALGAVGQLGPRGEHGGAGERIVVAAEQRDQ